MQSAKLSRETASERAFVGRKKTTKSCSSAVGVCPLCTRLSCTNYIPAIPAQRDALVSEFDPELVMDGSNPAQFTHSMAQSSPINDACLCSNRPRPAPSNFVHKLRRISVATMSSTDHSRHGRIFTSRSDAFQSQFFDLMPVDRSILMSLWSFVQCSVPH